MAIGKYVVFVDEVLVQAPQFSACSLQEVATLLGSLRPIWLGPNYLLLQRVYNRFNLIAYMLVLSQLSSHNENQQLLNLKNTWPCADKLIT